MAQDLRDLFKDLKHQEPFKMPEGHREEFLNKLNKQVPEKPASDYYWILKVAAVVALVVTAGISTYTFLGGESSVQQVVNATEEQPVKESRITLGDLSPDLNKLENYYVANINLELSELEITEETQKILDGYMRRMTELNDEYEKLTQELNQVGPNDQTINALIDNLQLRLQLLYRLKEKINQFKNSKNEQFTSQEV